jgi:hypothetical protein
LVLKQIWWKMEQTWQCCRTEDRLFWSIKLNIELLIFDFASENERQWPYSLSWIRLSHEHRRLKW